MAKNEKISVQGTEITVVSEKSGDYISLTDIARYKNTEKPNVVVANWLHNHNTIEYLGTWEQLNNPNFKPLEIKKFIRFSSTQFRQSLYR
ncbi:MAG: KilA-N domain-containing protein [Chitinispirillales bacterium]|jgi:hypothetical protein|nr:KilA-N domain-containing protein [Chitinispirillales bacterium]